MNFSFVFIANKRDSGISEWCFLIGGAYGFSYHLEPFIQAKLSLSKMTFTHQMVRLIFSEQLYRAFSILKGEPYHHD
jgi:23S rRNA (pseudouridine1915-N3)-methyltransferase